ncbi:MAG: hypothetical protein JW855_03735 [Gammaproteobacteria bacterium]|nr:hypothetical protein [Gammaproteobacteria bacterium]
MFWSILKKIFSFKAWFRKKPTTTYSTQRISESIGASGSRTKPSDPNSTQPLTERKIAKTIRKIVRGGNFTTKCNDDLNRQLGGKNSLQHVTLVDFARDSSISTKGSSIFVKVPGISGKIPVKPNDIQRKTIDAPSDIKSFDSTLQKSLEEEAIKEIKTCLKTTIQNALSNQTISDEKIEKQVNFIFDYLNQSVLGQLALSVLMANFAKQYDPPLLLQSSSDNEPATYTIVLNTNGEIARLITELSITHVTTAGTIITQIPINVTLKTIYAVKKSPNGELSFEHLKTKMYEGPYKKKNLIHRAWRYLFSHKKKKSPPMFKSTSSQDPISQVHQVVAGGPDTGRQWH